MSRTQCISAALFVVLLSSAAAAQDWYLRTPPVSPPAREGHAMAYDAARKRVVLHGGVDGPYPYLNDTWEWDGQTWKQCSTPANTPFRAYPALAYDTARKRVLLFGGYGATNILQEWDGSGWRQVAPPSWPPSAPLARFDHPMAYDSVRKKLVVYGGMNSPFTPLLDTWEWDASAGWSQRFPVTSPSTAQALYPMAFDAARKRMVMVGYYAVTQSMVTWQWDGITWAVVPKGSPPPVSHGHAMAYDSTRHRVMLVWCDETWEWDGTNWTQHQPRTRLAGRASHAMAYDAARNCLVVFGGRWGSVLRADTWEYGFPASITLSGSARPGGRVDLHLRTMSDGGLAYQAGSSLGTGPIPVDQRTLGLSADELLRVSTSNALPWIFSGYSGRLDARGEANAAVRLPAIPALVGTRIHTAFVTLDPKAPSGIRSISNPATFTVNP